MAKSFKAYFLYGSHTYSHEKPVQKTKNFILQKLLLLPSFEERGKLASLLIRAVKRLSRHQEPV
jgi:hypothetical protein